MFLFIFSFSLFSIAQGATSEESAHPSYLKEFFNMILTLVFVLSLAFISVFFLKKIMRSKMTHFNQATGIKILERRALNPKASLYLVDILGKGVVIGESQSGGIQLITEFPSNTDLELLLAQETELLAGKKKTPFKSLQNEFLKLFKKRA